MNDEAINRYLTRVYEYRVEKVGALTNSIKSKRKEKIGIKYRALGIFPIYNYRYWEVELSEWKKLSLSLSSSNRFISKNVNIKYCIDEYNKVVYWKYEE